MGEELTKKSAEKIRRKVGVVFQDPDDQVFSSTVWEDVQYGPKNLGMKPDEIESRCNMALGSVGMLEHKNAAPFELSYGQRKRVAIAGILAMQPDIVVLDEPMAYLDPKGQDEVASLLQGLYYMGKTILVATHDVNFAASWADQVIIIKDGQVLAAGGPELLVQEEWITQASLHFPMVARPFQLLSGIEIETLPKTEREAARLIIDILEKQMSLVK